MRYAIDGKYPIETKDQLSKTASYFDKYLVRFHPKERVKIAATLEKRAQELGVYLDNGWVKNYSRAVSEDPVLSPDFQKNLEMRKHACNGIKFSDEISASDCIDRISELTKTAPSYKIEKLLDNTKTAALYKIVDIIFDFDKRANLEYQWDKTIVDPVMTVFGSMNNPEYDAIKIAGELTNYKIKRIASNEQEVSKIASAMGKNFQTEFSKTFES
jgi:hypothetical protein